MDLVDPAEFTNRRVIGWFLATLELTRHHGAAVEQDSERRHLCRGPNRELFGRSECQRGGQLLARRNSMPPNMPGQASLGGYGVAEFRLGGLSARLDPRA